jgi:penicillin amidase
MKRILPGLLPVLYLLCAACGGSNGAGTDAAFDGGASGADASGDDGGGGDNGNAAIEILIDNMGIPHIFAATDEDAFFAAGYQVAGDRLYQMEMLRRFALGRLSEVIGEEGLARDQQARTFDFPRWGREDMAVTRATDPERARLLLAWVAGINKKIGEIRSGLSPLPFGYRAGERDFIPEPWDEADPYIILKGAGFANDKTVEFEVALSLLHALYAEAMDSVQIFKPAHPYFGVPPEDRPQTTRARFRAPGQGTPKAPGPASAKAGNVFEGLGRLIKAMPGHMGSNNWAISGRFTETGRPLVAGDPHLSFGFFGSAYPMHINSRERGGTYNTAGFNYPGTPGITLGFNDRMIWTVTTNMGDVMDLWKVGRQGDRVNVGDRWIKITLRTERIVVREPGGPAGEGRVETMDYEDVPGYGVILPEEIIGIPGATLILGDILLNWTGFSGKPARWFMELNRISSIEDFEATVDRMREMAYNVIAADAEGISYRVGLDVPRRTNVSGAYAPWKTMDGGDPASLWTGEMLARTQIPGSRAFHRGWLATANTDPWGFTADGTVDTDPWYYGSFFDAGYRGQRIEDEITQLTRRGGVTLDDMKKLQMDTRSRLSDDLLPFLAEAHGRIATDDSLAEFQGDADLDRVVSLLTVEWDRRMARDSAGALAWLPFIHFMTQGTAVPTFFHDLTLIPNRQRIFEASWT